VKKILVFLPLLLSLVIGLQAQPYMITATNYASGLFGVVADENGQPLAVGSVIHLIYDSAGDGADDPSLQPGSMGMPTGDDVLMGAAQIGVTGGAPSAGTFVLPGTAAEASGWCYLRAFHAATPAQGTYYSESVAEYAIPPLATPTLYGVQFPSAMTRSLGDSPAVTVTLTPQNPPLMIPQGGGNFQYTLVLHNTTTQPVTYDLWVDAVLPNGSVYGPILTRSNLNMPGQVTWTRQMTQAVPAGAPAGVYLYRCRIGDQETGLIMHEDSFPFQKQGAGSGESFPQSGAGWQTSGWEDGLLTVPIPDVYFLSPPYPNPFNPAAQIQFGLPQASNVRIDVYNILGSRVTTLLNDNLDAGYHSVIWDASTIASGLYLVQMKAGGFVYTEKALLLK